MRRKVSTILDESLYRRAKLESARRGKQISEVLGEALAAYLARRSGPAPVSDVVAESWAVLRLPGRRVKRLLETEAGWLDA